MNDSFMMLFYDKQNDINRKMLRRMKRNNFILGALIGVVGYSVYVQATKIDCLKKEIKELKKGE